MESLVLEHHLVLVVFLFNLMVYSVGECVQFGGVLMTVKNAYPLPLIPNILEKGCVKLKKSTSLNWMSAGDTTTYRSMREMSGKWIFGQTKAC